MLSADGRSREFGAIPDTIIRFVLKGFVALRRLKPEQRRSYWVQGSGQTDEMVQRLVATRKGAKQVTSELTNAAFVTAQPGKSDELGRRLLALVEPTRREAGCLRYDIYRSNDDPNAWFVYEDWRTTDDFSAHMRTPYVQSFMADVPVLCATDVEICAYSRMSQYVLTR